MSQWKCFKPCVLALTLVIGVLLAGCWPPLPQGSSSSIGGLSVGSQAPPIAAAGWINGEPPQEGELAGKVIVVIAWAYW